MIEIERATERELFYGVPEQWRPRVTVHRRLARLTSATYGGRWMRRDDVHETRKAEIEADPIGLSLYERTRELTDSEAAAEDATWD